MKISINWLKIVISLSAIAVIATRIIWPDLKIDAITLGLIVVAILPWMTELIKSAKFPGGWEIEFRDIQEAGSKVTQAAKADVVAAVNIQTPEKDKPVYLSVFEKDPNLALVALRIEIEKRIRELAEKNGLTASRSLVQLLREMAAGRILPSSMVEGLEDLVQAGNQAAHGVHVQQGISDWAAANAPKILAALDEHLKK